MNTQTSERDFFSMADELREILAPHDEKKVSLFHRLENIFAIVRRSPHQRRYVEMENGKVALFTAQHENCVRIYELPEAVWPGYYMERISSEHYLIAFDGSGKITEINPVDVVGMKRDSVSGYHSGYWNPVSTKDMDSMTASQSYLPKLEKYLLAFETGKEINESR
jgi:hypothetical protein